MDRTFEYPSEIMSIAVVDLSDGRGIDDAKYIVQKMLDKCEEHGMTVGDGVRDAVERIIVKQKPGLDMLHMKHLIEQGIEKARGHFLHRDAPPLRTKYVSDDGTIQNAVIKRGSLMRDDGAVTHYVGGDPSNPDAKFPSRFGFKGQLRGSNQVSDYFDPLHLQFRKGKFQTSDGREIINESMSEVFKLLNDSGMIIQKDQVTQIQPASEISNDVVRRVMLPALIVVLLEEKNTQMYHYIKYLAHSVYKVQVCVLFEADLTVCAFNLANTTLSQCQVLTRSKCRSCKPQL